MLTGAEGGLISNCMSWPPWPRGMCGTSGGGDDRHRSLDVGVSLCGETTQDAPEAPAQPLPFPWACISLLCTLCDAHGAAAVVNRVQ